MCPYKLHKSVIFLVETMGSVFSYQVVFLIKFTSIDTFFHTIFDIQYSSSITSYIWLYISNIYIRYAHNYFVVIYIYISIWYALYYIDHEYSPFE